MADTPHSYRKQKTIREFLVWVGENAANIHRRFVNADGKDALDGCTVKRYICRNNGSPRD